VEDRATDKVDRPRWPGEVRLVEHYEARAGDAVLGSDARLARPPATFDASRVDRERGSEGLATSHRRWRHDRPLDRSGRRPEMDGIGSCPGMPFDSAVDGCAERFASLHCYYSACVISMHGSHLAQRFLLDGNRASMLPPPRIDGANVPLS